MATQVIEDKVNRPSHYTSGKIEVIDFIDDQKLDFCLGNAIKYIARAGKKSEEGMTQESKTIQDLEKAVWYLNHEIKTLKSRIPQDCVEDLSNKNIQEETETNQDVKYVTTCVICGKEFEGTLCDDMCPECSAALEEDLKAEDEFLSCEEDI